MKVPRLDKSIRNLQRLRHIATIFLKYGFSEVVDRLNLVSRLNLKRFRRQVQPIHRKYSAAERVRLAFEELGPTFIKLGQLLSTHAFMIPAGYVQELSKLQDSVKPVPFEELRPVIEEELGKPLDEVFTQVIETATASASMAQVHQAQMYDGTKVILKIRRPQIVHIVNTDMEILHYLAGLIERYMPETKQYNPTGLVEELARSMKKELNFLNEARNIERFARNFADDEFVHIPKVYWEYCAEQVLTMEYIAGVKISDINALRNMGVDLDKVVHQAARFILKQIFIDGFFHADPHPGNIFISYDHKLALIDYGIMGRFDNWLMLEVSDLLIALTHKDIELVIRVLVDLGALDDNRDTTHLRYDISEYVDRWYGLPFRQLNLKTIFNEGLEIMNRHYIRLPSNLLLLMKTVSMYDDLGRQLDPEFNIYKELEPFVRKMLRKRLEPAQIAYELGKTLRDFYVLFKVMPREFEVLMRRLRKGNISVELQHLGLDHLIREVDRSSNRLSFSLIIAAIIVASSLIMHINRGPYFLGYPLFGILGYIFAGILGVGLVIDILRSGKLR